MMNLEPLAILLKQVHKTTNHGYYLGTVLQ